MQTATSYFFSGFAHFERSSLFQRSVHGNMTADDHSAEEARDRADFMLEMLAHEPGNDEIHAMHLLLPDRF